MPVFFLTLLLLVQTVTPAWAEEEEPKRIPPPEIQSKAALLVDQKTGAVVYAKQEKDELYPASTTKIMTCLLVLEAIDQGKLSLSQEVTATASAMEGLAEDGSTAGIQPGEVMTVESLLYCMMMGSANEASTILGEQVAGSVEAFVEAMNAKAKALGCENTHFMNPHGLHDSQHYTSAWDLYLITKEALEYPDFLRICDTRDHTVPATNLSEERTLHNTNFLIRSGRDYYNPDVHGVKTGSHSQAGHCLVSTAQKASLSFLCVVLGADRVQKEDNSWWTYSFGDSNLLYKWGFENFNYQTVLKEEDVAGEAPVALSSVDHVTLCPIEAVELLLPKNVKPEDLEKVVTLTKDPAEAPITAGDVLGSLSIRLEGEECATVDLVALTDVEASRLRVLWRDVKVFFSGTAVRIAAGIILALAVIWGVWKLLFSRRRYRYGRNVSSRGRNGYRGRRRH